MYMPKSLVIPLEDELYKQFASMCKDEGKCLKDYAYEVLKGAVEAYQEYLKDEEEKRRKQEEAKPREKVLVFKKAE